MNFKFDTNLTYKNKRQIDSVGYVVTNLDNESDSKSFKDKHIFKVTKSKIYTKVDGGKYLTLDVELDCKGSTENGWNSQFFRLAKPDEVKLYELCKEPVHINQINVLGDLSIAKKDQLINEAKKRGFVKGVKAVCLRSKVEEVINDDDYNYFESTNSIFVGNTCVYDESKWSKVINEEKYAGNLPYDWYKYVKVGDWIKCFYGDSRYKFNRGKAWEFNKEYEVLHITLSGISDDRLIFVVNEDGSGVFNSACVPIEKPNVNDEGLWKKIKKSIVRGVHPGYMIVDEFKEDLIEESKILPMRVVRRKKRNVKTETLGNEQIVNLLIKKRKRR